MQVVGYLDLTTIIRMACVSMEWRYSLFSEEIAFWVVQNNPFLVEDILSTAFNSRAWRNVLLQKRISLLVIERHFRQRWYQYSTAQPQQSAEDLQEWLANSMESLMKQVCISFGSLNLICIGSSLGSWNKDLFLMPDFMDIRSNSTGSHL